MQVPMDPSDLLHQQPLLAPQVQQQQQQQQQQAHQSAEQLHSSSQISLVADNSANCSLVKQRRRKHAGPPIRPTCSICGKDFSNQSALSKHKLTHSDVRRFSCNQCGKAFKRQDHLNGHMLTHRDKKPYECDVEGCEKTYCDARSLRRHKENHHSGHRPVSPSCSSSSLPLGPVGSANSSAAAASTTDSNVSQHLLRILTSNSSSHHHHPPPSPLSLSSQPNGHPHHLRMNGHELNAPHTPTHALPNHANNFIGDSPLDHPPVTPHGPQSLPTTPVDHQAFTYPSQAYHPVPSPCSVYSQPQHSPYDNMQPPHTPQTPTAPNPPVVNGHMSKVQQYLAQQQQHLSRRPVSLPTTPLDQQTFTYPSHPYTTHHQQQPPPQQQTPQRTAQTEPSPCSVYPQTQSSPYAVNHQPPHTPTQLHPPSHIGSTTDEQQAARRAHSLPTTPVDQQSFSYNSVRSSVNYHHSDASPCSVYLQSQHSPYDLQAPPNHLSHANSGSSQQQQQQLQSTYASSNHSTNGQISINRYDARQSGQSTEILSSLTEVDEGDSNENVNHQSRVLAPHEVEALLHAIENRRQTPTCLIDQTNDGLNDDNNNQFYGPDDTLTAHSQMLNCGLIHGDFNSRYASDDQVKPQESFQFPSAGDGDSVITSNTNSSNGNAVNRGDNGNASLSRHGYFVKQGDLQDANAHSYSEIMLKNTTSLEQQLSSALSEQMNAFGEDGQSNEHEMDNQVVRGIETIDIHSHHLTNDDELVSNYMNDENGSSANSGQMFAPHCQTNLVTDEQSMLPYSRSEARSSTPTLVMNLSPGPNSRPHSLADDVDLAHGKDDSPLNHCNGSQLNVSPIHNMDTENSHNQLGFQQQPFRGENTPSCDLSKQPLSQINQNRPSHKNQRKIAPEPDDLEDDVFLAPTLTTEGATRVIMSHHKNSDVLAPDNAKIETLHRTNYNGFHKPLGLPAATCNSNSSDCIKLNGNSLRRPNDSLVIHATGRPMSQNTEVTVLSQATPTAPCGSLSTAAANVSSSSSSSSPCNYRAVSVVVSSKSTSVVTHSSATCTLETVCAANTANESTSKAITSPKRMKNKPEPIYIPPHVNACGPYPPYQSRLRSPRLWEGKASHSYLSNSGSLNGAHNSLTHESGKLISPPPYTPPPMLSPVRTGSGLYWHIITNNVTPKSGGPLERPSAMHQSFFRSKIASTHLMELERDAELAQTPKTAYEKVDFDIHTFSESDQIQPHVNVGPQFQASIPEFVGKIEGDRDKYRKYKKDRADILWDPEVLVEARVLDEDLNNYLDVARSSCVLGTGRNCEYAHHLLYRAKGDLQLALIRLLDVDPMISKSDPLYGYSYAESDVWTSDEITKYHRALIKCEKDFFAVSKEMESKSVKQCIQFYYLWKKVCTDEYRKLKNLRWKREQENFYYKAPTADEKSTLSFPHCSK